MWLRKIRSGFSSCGNATRESAAYRRTHTTPHHLPKNTCILQSNFHIMKTYANKCFFNSGNVIFGTEYLYSSLGLRIFFFKILWFNFLANSPPPSTQQTESRCLALLARRKSYGLVYIISHASPP